MVFQLYYHSLAKPGLTGQDISDILRDARRKNVAAHITGCLLFHQNEFLQLLEGEQEKVETLYNRILEDPRHVEVSLIHSGNRSTRLFQRWAMAFQEMNDMQMQELGDHLTIGDFSRLKFVIPYYTNVETLFFQASERLLRKA